jgi:hypothetical protein
LVHTEQNTRFLSEKYQRAGMGAGHFSAYLIAQDTLAQPVLTSFWFPYEHDDRV